MVTAALPKFIEWLPGELDYSARKAPYPRKYERLKIDTEAPDSMVGFLAAQWHHAFLLAQQGAHHSPEHQKTAQLQYAKFAAGIFDKIGLINWIRNDKKEDQKSLKTSIGYAADIALSAIRHPASFTVSSKYPHSQINGIDYRSPFDFAFKEELTSMQKDIFDVGEGRIKDGEIGSVESSIIDLGIRATAAYLNYAIVNLEPSQYSLAPSVLDR